MPLASPCHALVFRERWKTGCNLLLQCREEVKASTYGSYRHKVERYILPGIGCKKLGSLTRQDIVIWSQSLQNKLSPSSIVAVIGVLSAALRKAQQLEYLASNPCAGLPLSQEQPKRRQALSHSQHRILEQIAYGQQGCTATVLGLSTGMRIGEISALCWQDIDWDKGVIYVRRTLQRLSTFTPSGAKSHIVFSTPKSAHASRVIPMAPRLYIYLKKLREQATGEYIVASKGHFAEPRVISYRFEQLLKRAGLPHINFHCLRHTFATRYLEHNSDIVTLSRLLGHASIKMTLDIYADSLLEQRRTAIYRMDAYITGKQTPTLVAAPSWPAAYAHYI